ncbi:MAG: NUDIX hydrolase [Parcubacteria group bacterium]|nr:NUDIX hydrolase [Parcubacteria group bacterium]
MSKQHHYFIGEKSQPFQLSVGAVVVNGKNQVLCHHFSGVRGSLDIYSLMRQTVEPNKSLEEMIVFGLEKEFGVRAKIKSYLGSIVGQFTNWEDAEIEKTTVYFLCEYNGEIKNSKKRDEESEGIKGKIEWLELDDLMIKMKSQVSPFNGGVYNESSILQRVKSEI